ncbi:two-component system response regulator BtsR [Oleisolibacter albus]|uniref:two-component system response regulator BtsR n=1 Tax=Oleisolibacter albus TaxID=2171757 RepID=UPI000DF2B669|nr:two-component system response regulator BtsR [Oleisolibacter albus]
MRVLIVDDEQLARDELRSLLEEAPDVEVVGECSNAIEGIAAINRLTPDVVFLDIQMPRVSGIEMLGMLDPVRMPRIVFVTAFDEYALKAFEAHAFDYLLKPTDPARLERTLQHLRHDQAPQNLAALNPPSRLRQIPCWGRNRITLLKVEEVQYIASTPAGIYVIGPDGQERFTELSLRTLEEKTDFFRCHRQYLVNLDHIKEIALIEGGMAEIITDGDKVIPVSRRYLGPLKERLGAG